MAFSLIEELQKSLGFPALKKVDPNVQEPKAESTISSDQRLAQAAVPGVLAGIFKLSQSENGARLLLSGFGDRNWLHTIYEGKEEIAVDKVAQYAGASKDDTINMMDKTACEAVRIIRQHAGAHATADSVKAVIKDHRHEVLSYLPAAMQMGYLLNDNTLDDRTNKMEGPISNLMHAIENKLSGSNS